MAQLVERPLPFPGVQGSNPVIGKNIIWTVTVSCIEKTKIKKQKPRIARLTKENHNKKQKRGRWEVLLGWVNILWQFLQRTLAGASCVYGWVREWHPVWPDLAKFHHFSKYWKIFGNIFKVFWFWPKFSTHFGTICMFLGKFHRCKWPNIENTIWSSGHTDDTTFLADSQINK